MPEPRPRPSSHQVSLPGADNPPVLVKRLLEKLGCRVDIAGDGCEALRMVARQAYALIFMDCSMPKMDGYQATAELRRQFAGGPRIPIVAFTANAMTGIAPAAWKPAWTTI